MTYEEIDKVLEELVKEYFVGTESNKRPKTLEEKKAYGRKVKRFFVENDVPRDLSKRFGGSHVGESFYMAMGFGIMEDY